MKVLDAQTNNTRSLSKHCYAQPGGAAERVSLFVAGLGEGDSVRLDALAPDGETWLEVVAPDNPITKNGLYVFDGGANVLSLLPANTTGNAINAWIEPDSSGWRDSVRKLGTDQ